MRSLTVLALFLALLFSACGPKEDPAWQAFLACTEGSCIEEALDVRDALLRDPAAMLVTMDGMAELGDDRAIGWLFILRDSVLGNPAYAPVAQRSAERDSLLRTLEPFLENGQTSGEMATALVTELRTLNFTEEEVGTGDAFLPIGGTYQLGDNVETTGSKQLAVQRTSFDTLHFSLELVNGPPAYNQGTMEGYATLTGSNTYQYRTTEFGDEGCTLEFLFSEGKATVRTLAGTPPTCGFGNGVVADGAYTVVNHQDPFLSGADSLALAQFQGEWVAEDDPLSGILLKDGIFSMRYEGQSLEEAPYVYHPRCPADCAPAGDFGCLALYGQDVVCYALVSSGPAQLELSMVGGRGNTLRYRRVQ
ncbi:hypothetical protein QWY85_15295 [Neolewinella lacunae]|uniref:Lipoprotein n=1 Tax=Neolewinella lacunae TaxID=1517758 RepID=A0A923T7E8_9BACT|nr:hypothetical protein [Neolewinella lacunae]MBC6992788.1 hypothetical protein [Neolewinella lacunae]MDN3636032.1 hypothetical protein [Neolewinella lacunae]